MGACNTQNKNLGAFELPHTHGHCDNSLCDGFQPTSKRADDAVAFSALGRGRSSVPAGLGPSRVSVCTINQSPAWLSPHCASARVPFPPPPPRCTITGIAAGRSRPLSAQRATTQPGHVGGPPSRSDRTPAYGVRRRTRKSHIRHVSPMCHHIVDIRRGLGFVYGVPLQTRHLIVFWETRHCGVFVVPPSGPASHHMC